MELCELENNGWRQDFPMLSQTMHQKPLIYLDSGASALKPQPVINAITNFYQQAYSSVHRGVYQLSANATLTFESVRIKVQEFINAASPEEIIFTSGTTESINLVAYGFSQLGLTAQDNIIISQMEHHANFVPWQILCQKTGAELRIIKLNDNGDLDLDHFQQLLSSKTRLVAVTHVSNVIGTVNPIHKIVNLAHRLNVPVLVDGAQAVPHLPVNIRDLDCDFYVFSAHKLYGPTGVGVLYGKTNWLNRLPPYKTGGNMIRRVCLTETEFQDIPNKFEAGTPNVAGVIGFGAALNYIQQIGIENISSHEKKLVSFTHEMLADIPEITVLAHPAERIGVFSLNTFPLHPHDLGTFLDHQGIAVRVGHHCAMPLIEHFKVPATMRLSLGMYNDQREIEIFCKSLKEAIAFFR